MNGESMRRRTFIAGSGATLASLGGCMQVASRLRARERTPTETATDGEEGRDWSRAEAADLSIDGRIHNGADDTRTFAVRIRDSGDLVMAYTIAVGSGSTKRLPAWGAPGEERTIAITADGTTTVETFAFDVESTPGSDPGPGTGRGRLDGFVDVVYLADGTLDVRFTPVDADEDGRPDAVPVLRGHAVSDRASTPDAERHSEMDPWGLFVATRETAEAYFGDGDEAGSDDVRGFIDRTAFEDGDRLLYIQAYAPQTCYELALDGAPSVAEDGRPRVETAVRRTASDEVPCGDAVTAVRLLLRLSFHPGAGVPEAVAVRVTGDRSQEDVFEVATKT